MGVTAAGAPVGAAIPGACGGGEIPGVGALAAGACDGGHVVAGAGAFAPGAPDGGGEVIGTGGVVGVIAGGDAAGAAT